MQIRFLQPNDFALLYPTYLSAFSDYVVKMQPTEAQLLELFARRGIEYHVSTGAFIDDQMIAFNLCAIDQWQGQLTAYDLSSGVVPAYRGQRLTAQLFDFSLPKLKELGVNGYLLEVIDANEKALRAYLRIGFTKVRYFDCFLLKSRDVMARPTTNADIDYQIDVAPDWTRFSSFWDWQPSWQNSINSIERSQDRRIIITATMQGEIIGYGIIFPSNGDIPQLAIEKNYRRRGIAANIMKLLLQQLAPEQAARLINLDSVDRAMIDFARAIGCEYLVTQHEMYLNLSSKYQNDYVE